MTTTNTATVTTRVRLQLPRVTPVRDRTSKRALVTLPITLRGLGEARCAAGAEEVRD